MATMFPVQNTPAPATTLADHSGTTTAATSVQIMAADDDARMYRIQNLSTTVNLWVNDMGGAAAPYTPGSYMLAPGAYYEFPSVLAVSVYADSVIPFSAGRY
ncbi:hypothetical protein [Kosakonia radicincitans]|uniref:hypothetical protein n=1 Tax=Kosakonia radicincitans TaxID=283686 RepID=UPI001D06E46E|nr:hypothetical protein [Kosakonia radicincitans]